MTIRIYLSAEDWNGQIKFQERILLKEHYIFIEYWDASVYRT